MNLTLKKQWFGMIASGEKREVYHEIKPYWIKRLLEATFPPDSMESDGFDEEGFWHDVMNMKDTSWDSYSEMMAYFKHRISNFDVVKFTNGNGNDDKPSVTVELDSIVFGEGKKEWGAVVGETYFCLQLGKVIDSFNIAPAKRRVDLGPCSADDIQLFTRVQKSIETETGCKIAGMRDFTVTLCNRHEMTQRRIR